MIELDTKQEYGAKIRIVGVGGGGSNAVNAMINKGLEGVEFCVLNTDAQALEKSEAEIKMQIGKNLTRGLGAGADPEVGRKAVEEDREEIGRMLAGSDMVFVTAGMGGGTGTGGASVVANIAKSIGALVVGIVTKPFSFEGKRRSKQAEEGIEELRKNVDTLIVIPNQKLLALVEQATSFLEGFSLANQVLYNATRGISELIIRHGYINVDFADVRTVMREMGDAIMGSGIGRGEHRAAVAAEHAISSPLLEGVSIQGAQGVLVNITGGRSMSLLEVSEATQIIHDAAGDDANLIFGAVLDDSMEEEIMVTVIATGFNSRPKYTGLSYRADHAQRINDHAPLGMPHEDGHAKPRVERITQPMDEPVYADRKNGALTVPALRETGMHADSANGEDHGVQLPKIERIYQPRGTLTEKDRPSGFDRRRMETIDLPTNANERSNGSVVRLTPKTDTRHVPSGPRDLKDYDQPAYLRRGIALPPIEDAEERSFADAQVVMQESKPAQQEEPRAKDRDDRPAFLKRIMD
jgi:cell division protein FtsZ